MAIAALLTIVAVLAGILTRKLSPLVAFTVIPALAAAAIGQGDKVGGYMFDGMVRVSGTAAMFLFAILYFSILAEAGLFKPVIDLIIKTAGRHPARVTLGTAVLTTVAHLDGSGASTFLIVIPALLPIYDSLGLDRRVLACVVAMSAGVGNMLPWGGPTIRAASALDQPVMAVFGPLLPAYGAGLATVFALSWWLGRRHAPLGAANADQSAPNTDNPPAPNLGWRYAINAASVVVVLTLLLLAAAPPAIVFLFGLAFVLVINHVSPDDQRRVIERHAPAAVGMVAILLAAGAFSGILMGAGMLDALARESTSFVPEGGARWIPLVLALISMPLSLLFDPDSFYFGVLPVLSTIADGGGGSGVAVAQAALLGQMTVGFPVSPLTASTFLLVGLSKIDLAEHQRFSIPYLYVVTLVMTGVCLLSGVIGP